MLEITKPNQHWLFEESIDLGIANEWGVHLVYGKRERSIYLVRGKPVI